MKLFYVIGISGSGKSTYALKFAKDNNLSYVSSDDIRREICGDTTCQDFNREVFTLAEKRVRYHLLSNRSVIFDATNYKPSSRKFLKDIKDYFAYKLVDVELVAICLDVPFDICKSRNEKRERSVPLFVK